MPVCTGMNRQCFSKKTSSAFFTMALIRPSGVLIGGLSSDRVPKGA